ncbi:MAG: hypothetical protein QF767_08065, partial [Alphaproteobacteria bacterium]|nr:hypothetical protein [Alphaproteobacteria bacterium]
MAASEGFRNAGFVCGLQSEARCLAAAGMHQRIGISGARTARAARRRCWPSRWTARTRRRGTTAVMGRERHGGQALRAVRRLHRLYLDYPTAFLVDATRTALDFGVTDIGRLETMTLR